MSLTLRRWRLAGVELSLHVDPHCHDAILQHEAVNQQVVVTAAAVTRQSMPWASLPLPLTLLYHPLLDSGPETGAIYTSRP